MTTSSTSKLQLPHKKLAWSVSGGIEALGTLSHIPFHLLFTDADAITEAYLRGVPLARELFGPDVSLSPPRWAAISYGHINCLGSQLIFPTESEVAHTPLFHSLADAICTLEKEIDFTRTGLFSHYLNLWETLKKRFPQENIPFGGFGAEGPVTTAWLLRGHAFFTDLYDDPLSVCRYLELVTTSVIRYKQLICRINGDSTPTANGISVEDDGAALIAPGNWPRFVVPYLDRCFSALTGGPRSAHIEGLCVDHLRFLDQLHIAHFDPSVSPKLSPKTIRSHAKVYFTWRLNEVDTATMTVPETENWVARAAADGAPAVRTGIWRNNCTKQAAANIRAFCRCCKELNGTA